MIRFVSTALVATVLAVIPAAHGAAAQPVTLVCAPVTVVKPHPASVQSELRKKENRQAIAAPKPAFGWPGSGLLDQDFSPVNSASDLDDAPPRKNLFQLFAETVLENAGAIAGGTLGGIAGGVTAGPTGAALGAVGGAAAGQALFKYLLQPPAPLGKPIMKKH